jgi:hypothetical protein
MARPADLALPIDNTPMAAPDDPGASLDSKTYFEKQQRDGS